MKLPCLAPLRIPAALAFATAFGSPAFAAPQRLMVPHDSPRAMIAIVDVGAGALFQSDWIDVAATATPPLTSSNVLTQAERVLEEIWVAGGLRVYRYDAWTRDFIGSFEAGAAIRSIDHQDERVVLTTIGRVESRDHDGALLELLNIEGASDTLDLGDGTMLVARQALARVERYTSDGTFLSVFAGPSVPTPFGVLSRPKQLARDGSGRILICGDVRTYIYEADGTFVDEIDTGPFEGGVASTFAGRLFVTLGTGMALHDPLTGGSVSIGGPFFGEGRKVGLFDRGDKTALVTGDPSSEITCRGDLNSAETSARAAVLGSPRVEDRLLALYGDRIPAGAIAFPLIARSTNAATLSQGRGLCLDRRSIQTPVAPMLAGPQGTIQASLVRNDEALITPLPGATIHVQIAYRDGEHIYYSDAASVTFGG